MSTKKKKKSKASKPMFSPYDSADYLNDKEDVEWFLAAALQGGDAAHVAHCLGVAARSKGMRQIAEETGLAREQLYRSLSAEGNPTLKTIMAVIKSLGLELTAKVKHYEEEEARVRAREATEERAKASI